MSLERGAIYVRVAAEGQSAERFLAQQEAQVRAAAASHRWPVAQVYRDTGSSRNADRPGLQQLLADAAAGCFEVLYVSDPSRLARDRAQFQQLYLQLTTDYDVMVVFTHESAKPGGAL